MGWRIAAALAAIMGLTAASAGAATYCVPGPSCSAGTAEPTLAAAISAANGTAEADDILLAAGTFTGGVTVGSYPIRIHGSGIGTTTIEGGGGLYGVGMDQPDSSIDNLTIHEPSGGHATALSLSGSAQNVVVDQRNNASNAYAAVILRGEGSFQDGSALAPLDSGGADYGIDARSTGPMLVNRVVVQGTYGMTTNGPGPVTIRFARVTGEYAGIQAEADNTLVDDSVVSGGPVVGYLFGGSGDILTTLRHVTLNGTWIAAESDNFTSRVVVSNSAVVGGGPDPETPDVYVSAAGATATAVVDADYSFFRSLHALRGMGGGTETLAFGSHNIDGADAKLLDAAAGDLRLTVASPLIDAGDPVPGAGEPQADLAGEFRAVNGRTDIGAYEYGRHSPGVSAAAEPAVALAGAAVKFSAGTSDADPGESPAVTWSFDDGGTAAGPSVSHAFATPGTHAATATATDPAGLKATATATVTISAPPPGLVRTAMAPAFQFRKLAARRNIVRLALSCPLFASRCTGRVELRLAHRRTVLGKARYSIAHGTIRTIKVKLDKSARKRLRRARHGLRIKVVVKPKGAHTATRTVTLRRR